MALQFNPPEFARPRDYGFTPGSIDEIMNALAQAQQMREAERLRGVQGAMQYGFNPYAPGSEPQMQAYQSQQQEMRAAQLDLIRAQAEKMRREPTTMGMEFAEPEMVTIDGRRYLKQDIGPGKPPRFSEVNERQPADFRNEAALRKEFQGLSKDFIKVRDSFSRVQASAQDPSAAGDLALIFNYMKILDPGSVVRESEFATASNAGGVDERTRALYNKVLSGERLSPAMRNDFVSRSNMLYSAQERNQKANEETYRGLAQQYGMDPSKIITTFRAEMEGQAAPQSGQVVERTLKGGRKVRVRKTAQGWEEVK